MNFSLTPARLAVLGFLLGSAFAASAQSSSSLSDVVITATRSPQPVADVVADVTVIDREDIQRRGVSTLTQLLNDLPGLQVIENSRVYIRGADSRMTALYIDGVRVDSHDGATVLGGGAPWDLVPLSQIDRVEVLRGPASAIYGSDAMGGVVQVFTERGRQGASPQASLGLGNRGTWRSSAGVSGASGAWDYALGLSRDGSDGHNTRPDLVHTPDHEGHRQSSLRLRLGHELARGQRVELSHLGVDQHSRYVPWDGGQDYDSFSRLTTTALQWSASWSELFSSRVSLSRANVDRQDTAGYDYRTLRDTWLIDNRWKLLGGEASLALERKDDRFDSIREPYAAAGYTGQRRQDGVAVGYGGRFGAHTLQANLRSDDDEMFGRHSSGSLAYGYDIARGWRVGGSVGNGFRAPTLEQVFSPYGSRSLQPETNTNKEVSLGYAQAGQAFKAVLFRNEFRNMISSGARTCAAGMFCYYNVGQAQVEGLSLSGHTQWAGYRLRGSMDWLQPKDEITGKDLSLRPRRQAFVGVSRPAGAWNVGADLRLVARRYDNASNTDMLPGYGVLGAVLSRPLERDWTLVLRADNLGDIKYQQVGALAMPGRTLLATLNWQPR